MYTTTSICPPYSFAAAMLCRLFGRPDSTKFSPEWLPLIDAVINANIMNLAQILSDNLAKIIIEYRRRSISSRVYPPFLWAPMLWTLFVLVQSSPLWDGNGLFRIHFPFTCSKRSCGNPIFNHIFSRFSMELCSLFTSGCIIEMPPGFPKKLKLTSSQWPDGSRRKNLHISEFLAASPPPHIHPYYVPDKLMARVIAYQTTSEGGMSHTLKV